MSTNKSRLAHTIYGNGKTVTVLIHGLLGTGRTLRPLARCLIQKDPRRTIILPDLRGHGSSPPLAVSSSLETLALDILQSSQASKDSPIQIIGHSLGGRVALKALEIQPEAVDSVSILDIGPGPIPDDLAGHAIIQELVKAPCEFGGRREARDLLVRRGLSVSNANWLALNLGPKQENGRFLWNVDRQLIALFHRKQSAEELWPVVECYAGQRPILCVKAGLSAFLSQRDLERMKDAGAQTTVIAEAGHFFENEQKSVLPHLLAGFG